MNTEDILTLLRTRQGELRQRADQKVSSIGIVSKETQMEGQRKDRESAQSDWETADELLSLIEQIERAEHATASSRSLSCRGTVGPASGVANQKQIGFDRCGRHIQNHCRQRGRRIGRLHRRGSDGAHKNLVPKRQ